MFESDLWWVFPLIMVVLCVFMMRGRIGSMCGHGSQDEEGRHISNSDSAKAILDKRFASGEINEQEYEEKKSVLDKRS